MTNQDLRAIVQAHEGEWDAEQWRAWVYEKAGPYGLSVAAMKEFDGYLQRGLTPSRAAWCAVGRCK